MRSINIYCAEFTAWTTGSYAGRPIHRKSFWTCCRGTRRTPWCYWIISSFAAKLPRACAAFIPTEKLGKSCGFDERIKHMVAAREDLLQRSPGIKETLLRAFRASFAYSERH